MKKNTLARKYEYGFVQGSVDIDLISVEKDQDYENETTWWIFEDGSALGLSSDNIIYIKDNYGRHVDNQQLGK